MISTMQLQILIDIGRINTIICIICIFFTIFPTSFKSLLVTPLACYAASKLDYWESSQK